MSPEGTRQPEMDERLELRPEQMSLAIGVLSDINQQAKAKKAEAHIGWYFNDGVTSQR